LAVEAGAYNRTILALSKIILPGAYGYGHEKGQPEDRTSFQASDRIYWKRLPGKKTHRPSSCLVAEKLVAHVSNPQFAKELFVSLEDVAGNVCS